ncbi:MAG: helix-turn-helix transcriptional regulator [Atopobiaceae bacterium]|jgi:transcriptional regulator with XRE-family HTH domain|nr:helix-turn-helix transcriptional regulator [Atopobiaceae bacterium]
MAIGTNIQRFRREAGIPQQELASAIGVSRAAIAQWEMGVSQPRLGALFQLADVLGTTPSKIVDYKRPFLGGICVSGHMAAVTAETPMQGGDATMSKHDPSHDQIEVPYWVLERHPRARFITVEASYINPVLPGMAHIVYDPYTMPSHGDLTIVRTTPSRHEIRRWQLSEIGIPLHGTTLSGIEYDGHDSQEYPYPLGVVCWYQSARILE